MIFTNLLLYTYHLIDRLDNGQHFVISDFSIAINIVQLECPIQLILHLAPRSHGKGADKLFEIDHPAVVRIENAKDIIGKG